MFKERAPAERRTTKSNTAWTITTNTVRLARTIYIYYSFFERKRILRNQVYNNIVTRRKNRIDIETSNSTQNDTPAIYNSLYEFTFIAIHKRFCFFFEFINTTVD